MVYTIVIAWWIAYWVISNTTESGEEVVAKRGWLMMTTLGYLSIGFAYIFAIDRPQYIVAVLIMTALHYMYSSLRKSLFALSTIVIVYFIKFH